jgi:biopolymer transport protein ExbD
VKLRASRVPQDDIAINVTSLVDVVLLLLIFFMLTTSFVRQSQLAVHLPEASGTEARQTGPAPELEITITARGGYFVNGRALIDNRRETLATALRQVMPPGRPRDVTIDADAQATHQTVVTAMDVVGELGFTDVHLATLQPRGRQ